MKLSKYPNLKYPYIQNFIKGLCHLCPREGSTPISTLPQRSICVLPLHRVNLCLGNHCYDSNKVPHFWTIKDDEKLSKGKKSHVLTCDKSNEGCKNDEKNMQLYWRWVGTKAKSRGQNITYVWCNIIDFESNSNLLPKSFLRQATYNFETWEIRNLILQKCTN